MATHTLEIRTIEHHAAHCRGQRDDREDQHRKGDGTKREPLRVGWSHIIERRHVEEPAINAIIKAHVRRPGHTNKPRPAMSETADADLAHVAVQTVHTRCARRRADRQASN